MVGATCIKQQQTMLGYHGPICSSQGRAALKNDTVPQFRFVGCLIYLFSTLQPPIPTLMPIK